jgi:truncated hemoglobin YjbI
MASSLERTVVVGGGARRRYGRGMDFDRIAVDEGGDPACWSHVFDAERHDLATRTDVSTLVRAFYRAAAMDDVLGPVFTAAHVDWPGHLEIVTDFWMDQLFGGPVRRRNPLRAHETVHQRTPLGERHFERWLELFTETVDEHFEGPTADLAKTRAVKMARALRRLLDGVSASGAEPIDVRWGPAADSAG